MPVFSLKTKDSFGTGEFTDLKVLVDWAKSAGLKLIQLLPVNDTTATHSIADSYPYAAISAFALHPLYINLSAVAGKTDTALVKPLAKKQKQLNALPALDYEQVMRFKMNALQELYQAHFKADENYFNFFELNRHWLVPYAAFCYLRDKYKTAEFSSWKTNSVYNEDAIQRLASPSQKDYDKIAIHYFIQYHLHLQLEEAAKYAHKNGIILKGDIPIGVYRNGCDAWMDPSLYHMDAQAGAPPDDFAVKGQNWSFPTYNWEKMQEDGFSWWRKRFEQMNAYFDAFRIDHILGFFRIWSIPLDAVQGILGKFVPAIPVHITELHSRNISFDHNRFCKPYITDSIIYQTFGDDADFVKENFFDNDNGQYAFKEARNTQRKIAAFFADESNAEKKYLQEGLFDFCSNIILIEQEGSHGMDFHFRIAMEQTTSFNALDDYTKQQLKALYVNYFYNRQDGFWKKEAMKKLPGLKQSTEMLLCGEDLGMVPHCVPEVMEQLGILSLEIQRMPKKTGSEFFHPNDAPYLSVVTPSTHDMSTVREWWQEDAAKTQRFYNQILGQYGAAPYFCEPWIAQSIIVQHLYSPAMWCIFQLQDILGMDGRLRRENPVDERINVPSNPNHHWVYRMHTCLEDLVKEKDFSATLKHLVTDSGRG
jgi:4-alpha-glucanotransferase